MPRKATVKKEFQLWKQIKTLPTLDEVIIILSNEDNDLIERLTTDWKKNRQIMITQGLI
jgi:hypothetical protein